MANMPNLSKELLDSISKGFYQQFPSTTTTLAWDANTSSSQGSVFTTSYPFVSTQNLTDPMQQVVAVPGGHGFVYGNGNTWKIDWNDVCDKVAVEEPHIKKERPDKASTFEEDILNKANFENVEAYDLEYEFIPRGKHFAGISNLKFRFRFKAGKENLTKAKSILTRYDAKWECLMSDKGTKEDICVAWNVDDAIKYLDIVLQNAGEFLVLKD